MALCRSSRGQGIAIEEVPVASVEGELGGGAVEVGVREAAAGEAQLAQEGAVGGVVIAEGVWMEGPRSAGAIGVGFVTQGHSVPVLLGGVEEATRAGHEEAHGPVLHLVPQVLHPLLACEQFIVAEAGHLKGVVVAGDVGGGSVAVEEGPQALNEAVRGPVLRDGPHRVVAHHEQVVCSQSSPPFTSSLRQRRVLTASPGAVPRSRSTGR